MPIILSQVVFTKKELEDMTGLLKSTIIVQFRRWKNET